MAKYDRQQAVSYQIPKRPAQFKAKAIPKRKTFGFSTAFQEAQKKVVANVMDVAHFLTRFLSGKRNVVLRSHPKSTSFFTYFVSKDRDMYYVDVPNWGYYDLPGVDEFSKYRIFRHGVYHESMHVKHTPTQLWGIAQGDPLLHDVVNVIEDRRIEDLGQQEWRGYVPERIFVQSYAYSVRPNIEKLYLKDKDAAIYEAYLQKLLIGKIKGTLPEAEMDSVGKAVNFTLNRLEAINNMEPIKRPFELKATASTVISLLGIQNVAPKKSLSVQGNSWDATFDPHAINSWNPTKSKEDYERERGEYFQEAKKKAKDLKEGDEAEAGEVTKDDVEQAQKGSVEVHSEYENVQKGAGLPQDLVAWFKSASFGNPTDYRDSKFITEMNTALRYWKTGYKEKAEEHGTRLSIPQYIREKEKPFVTRLKMSARGKKLLVLADFSGSMKSREEQCKKALVSAMEVLDGIGTKTAFFTFANDPAIGPGFFSIKTFEEPKWTSSHSAKLSALEADYPSTPTDSAYRHLRDYVRKHRPDVFVTVTDGYPSTVSETQRQIREMKKHSKMVAFGIAEPPDVDTMDDSLRNLGYSRHFVVSDVYNIPPHLVKLIAPK